MFRSFFDPMPKVVAHRGDSAHYPENTLHAFESAYAMGVDVIETDVHLSKDGEVVIWHDPTLDRNTNGSGMIEDHTLSELKELDAGYTFTKDDGKTFPFRGKGVQ
ncbi:MAG: glycerophosphodiester phosphodiesterase, partial [Spirochaetia bacterium]|nr:glycerophosphodiester phosphodiesterase [Spirochaetia bacterium]